MTKTLETFLDVHAWSSWNGRHVRRQVFGTPQTRRHPQPQEGHVLERKACS